MNANSETNEIMKGGENMQTKEIPLTAEQLLLRMPNIIENVLLKSDLHERAEIFTGIMIQARELKIERQIFNIAQNAAKEFNEPEMWELPQSLEKEVTLQPFPVTCLPKVLGEYLNAVCDFVQVDSSMIALPMLSVLSLCLQGKAIVAYPANAHTESINLYTLTVAPPGERKSGVFKALMRPVEEYQQRYNELHRSDIEEYKSKRQFLERQKQAAMSGKNASLKRVQELTRELCNLEQVHEMRLTCSDTTPEALAAEMLKQGGCMAVMDDEGSVFDVISGMYTGGQGNINLFLKAYDGSPHTIFRRTSDNITLNAPYLTIGIMTQPQQFMQTMSNPQFSGRGLMQRFLFAFPKGRAGDQSYISTNIPQNVQQDYDELITRLLKMHKNDTPVRLTHDNESYNVFHDYHDMLQSKMQSNGIFENMKEYASKQFGKVLKIAGLLHLCEHSVDEPINGQTALNAVSIGLWAENQALLAFDGGAGEDEITQNAKYIIKRLKSVECNVITLTKLKRLCRAVSDNSRFTESVELLEDMHYIRIEHIETGGRPAELYHINPFI